MPLSCLIWILYSTTAISGEIQNNFVQVDLYPKTVHSLNQKRLSPFSLVSCSHCLNYLYSGNPYTGTLSNNKNQDEMQQNAAFYQGLHCLLRLKQPSWREIHHNLETSSSDPLKYTMGNPILIVSKYARENPPEHKGLSIRLFRGVVAQLNNTLCDHLEDQAPRFILKLKIKDNDWLLAATWPQAANHCALF